MKKIIFCLYALIVSISFAYSSKDKTIFDYVVKGYFNKVKKLVKSKEDANLVSKDEVPLIIYAVMSEDLNMVKFLVSKGADVNAIGEGNVSVLQAAICTKRIDIVEYLVNNGANVNFESRGKDDPRGPANLLALSFGLGCLDIFKLLVHRGADVNFRLKGGVTPFSAVCATADLSLIEFMIKHGADVNSKDDYNDYILFNICKFGYLDVLKLFIENGADLKAKDDKGYGILVYACHSDNLDLIKYLFEQGVDDRDKLFVLMAFAIKKDFKMFEFCVKEILKSNNKDLIKDLVQRISDYPFGDDIKENLLSRLRKVLCLKYVKKCKNCKHIKFNWIYRLDNNFVSADFILNAKPENNQNNQFLLELD